MAGSVGPVRALAVTFALLSAWAPLGRVSRALAQPAPATRPVSIGVAAPSCTERPYDRSRLFEMLRVELAALAVGGVVAMDAPGQRPPGEVLLAVVTVGPDGCDPDLQEVTLQVVDNATSKTVARRLGLGDVAVAERPRVLAIAISELLSASLAEAEMLGAAPPRVEYGAPLHAALSARMRPAVDAARAEIDQRFSAWAAERDRVERAKLAERKALEERALLEGAILSRAYPTQGTALAGLAAGLRLRSGMLGLHFQVDGGLGRIEVPDGRVTVGSVTGGVGGGFVTEGPLELEIGPAFHAGYGFASGSSDVPSTRGQFFGGTVALAVGRAALRLHTGGAFTAGAAFEAGYTLAGVSFLSDTSRVAGIGGPLLGLSVGVGAPL